MSIPGWTRWSHSRDDLVSPHFWQELPLDDDRPFDIHCEYVVIAFENEVVTRSAETWRNWVRGQPNFPVGPPNKFYSRGHQNRAAVITAVAICTRATVGWQTRSNSPPCARQKHVYDLRNTCLAEVDVWVSELGPDGKRK